MPLIKDFIDFQNAKLLLDRQLKYQKEESPLFVTNFEFINEKYSSIGEDPEGEELKNYFDEKVKNNLFYGLENEFFTIKYKVPKKLFGVRNYLFFSYPLFLCYYAVGLYILRVANNILEHRNEKKSILEKNNIVYKFYSGTRLQYTEKKKICIDKKVLNYQKHHKDFIERIKKEVKNFSGESFQGCFIINLDAENYFDNIKIDKLLDFVDSTAKSKKEYSYNSVKKQEIIDFFKFIKMNRGLPQGERNLISNLLADLFFTKADFKILEYLNSKDLNFKFFRYVDDIYLIFDENEVSLNEIPSIKQYISSIIKDSLDVPVNQFKSKIFYVRDRNSYEDFIKNLKKVSLVEELGDDEEGDFEDEITKVIQSLKKIKKLPEENQSDSSKMDFSGNEENLKSVFNKKVLEFLTGREEEKIKGIFFNFNFDLINLSPKEIITIVTKLYDIKEQYKKFIKTKESLTFFDLYPAERFICEDKSFYKNIKEKISDKGYSKIFSLFWGDENENRIVTNIDPYNFSFCYINPSRVKENYDNKNKKSEELIEQIKLRELAKTDNNYSLALNHLLNEFQLLCYLLEGNSMDFKNYTALQVSNFLVRGKFSSEEVLEIEACFSRRNENNISHPGINIDKEEYYFLEEKLSNAIKNFKYVHNKTN